LPGRQLIKASCGDRAKEQAFLLEFADVETGQTVCSEELPRIGLECLHLRQLYRFGSSTCGARWTSNHRERSGSCSVAQEIFSRLGFENVLIVKGRFRDTLDQVLADGKSFDFFIDGHHDEDATLEYFDLISVHLSEGAVVIFDDISWSPGMSRAWKALKGTGAFSLTVDMSVVGDGIFGGVGVGRRDVKIPIAFVGVDTCLSSSQ